MGINVVIKTGQPKCLAKITSPKDKAPKFALNWVQASYQFVATFAPKEPVMALYLIEDGKVIDETEMQYPASVLAVSTDRFWKDLKLKQLAECLIAQAAASGKIEGESIHTLLA